MAKPTNREWAMIALLGPIVAIAFVGIISSIWQAVAEGGWPTFALIVWSFVMVVGFFYLWTTNN